MTVGVCRAVQVRLVPVRVNDFLIGMITFVGVKFEQTPLFYPRGFTVGVSMSLLAGPGFRLRLPHGSGLRLSALKSGPLEWD